jgi:hypothetical protein
MEYIEKVDDEWHPGYHGDQVKALLTDVDKYSFNVHVEDIDVNCAWYIFDIESGVFETEFDVSGDDTDKLVAGIEVTRFPDV